MFFVRFKVTYTLPAERLCRKIERQGGMPAFFGGTFQVHRRLEKCAFVGRNCVVLGVILVILDHWAPIWTPREPKVPKMCVLGIFCR